jgi:aminopeptidase YwaD
MSWLRWPLRLILLLVVLTLAACSPGRPSASISDRSGRSPAASPPASPGAPGSPALPGRGASPLPSPSPLPEPSFSVDRAMEHVRVLAVDIGVRPAGSAGEERAAAYIESVFRANGYEVARQPFRRPDGGASFNVVARARGADYAAGYLVVGGHYDTVASSPGGNDNATGTAVVLALAESLSGRGLPVELVAFAAEERQPPTGEHHLGSAASVAALADPGAVRAMVSIDMVGNGPAISIGRLTGSPDGVQSELVAAAQRVGIPHRPIVRGDISDHGPFARRGIPAAWLWSGPHPAFHSAADTFEVVRPEVLGWAGRATLRWIMDRTSPGRS